MNKGRNGIKEDDWINLIKINVSHGHGFSNVFQSKYLKMK